MDKKKKQVMVLHSTYALFLLIAFIMVVMFGFMSYSPDNDSGFDDFSCDWYREDHSDVNFSKIKESMRVEKNIPDQYHDQMFTMRVKNLNVRIYLDGELCDSYGFNRVQNGYYKSLGTYYVYVFLGDHKSISMDVVSVYENDMSCNIKSMYVGNAFVIHDMYMKEMLPGFCVSLLIFTLGIIFCVSAFALRKYGPQVISLVSLGTFGIVFGVWSGLEMQLLQYITGYIGMCHVGIHTFLMFITIPLLIFFKQRGATKSDAGSNVAIVLSIITFLINVILHFTGIMDMHETIKLTHISILLGCFLTLFYGYHVFKNSKGRDSSFWGLSIVAICTAVDLVMYYSQITSDSSFFIKIGVMSYLILLFIGIIREYVSAYSANLRAKMLEQMAYEDLLTGFYNHNMFISDMKIMDKNFDKHRGKSILMFDMNCLKYINDTFGHTMGDTALRECAVFISDVFGSIGKCYRTGGDEFAVITDRCVTDKLITDLHDVFMKKLSDRNNKSDKSYPLYIAFGYDMITVSTHVALQNADANMYKNKVAIKEDLLLKDPALVRS